MSGPTSELLRLQQAVRSAAVERRGTVSAASGRIYEYQVHGAGYTFREFVSGTELHFDVISGADNPLIRVSALSIQRYLNSIGASEPLEVIQAELIAISANNPQLEHVTGNLVNCFVWVG